MLLNLTDALKHQGDSRPFSISGDLPGDALPAGISLVSPVVLTGTVSSFGHELAIVGRLTAAVQAECAKCLRPVSVQIDCDYNQLLRRVGYENETQQEDEDEEDAILFDGSSCDLTASAVETLNLHLPIRFVCSDECKGLCPICGTDLNQQDCGCAKAIDSPFSALADLLKKDQQ